MTTNIIKLKTEYRIRLDYPDGAREYMYGLHPERLNWLFSDRANSMVLRTASIASRAAYEITRAIRHQTISDAQYAVAVVETSIKGAQYATNRQAI